MNGLQLRDEIARDRVRLATEFLDPSLYCPGLDCHARTNISSSR